MTAPHRPGQKHAADKAERKKKGLELAPLTAEEIEEAIGEVETRLERLRALYDMYFTGIERLEPQIQKKDVERRIYQLRKEQIKNTGLRFRFNMLVQRYNTLQTYWMRVSRAIEEGRYRRDVLKRRQAIIDARARRRDSVYEVRDSDLEPMDDDVEEMDAELLEDESPPVSAPAPVPERAAPLPVDRPQVAPASGGGLVFRRPKPSEVALQAVRVPEPDADALSDRRMREIYARYIEVRKECKESIGNVPFEKMAKALKSMEPELRKKAGGRKVDFEVTIKDGKAFLKPVAR